MATGRRLEVLSILQRQPGVTATTLAQRLGVTERTARRDIAHLRDLGYRIDAEAGRYGGYRLASGRAMPPLALDDDEALAVAVGLRSALSVRGLDTAAGAALAKLTQMLPTRLGARLDALALIDSPRDPGPRAVEPDVLVVLALACRTGESVRFRHRRDAGGPLRSVQATPHRIVTVRGRWYLVAFRPGARRWTAYAVDRILDLVALGVRRPAPEPPADAVEFVRNTLSVGSWRHEVKVRVFTSAELVRELVDPSVARVEADGDECIMTLGTDDLDWAARWLVHTNLDVDVIAPPELADRLRRLGSWLVDRYT